ncbi:hypothetical protein ACJRO7_029095 [Eucalyptus globulus]|uniref:non-specific serine/threonine protein kinase n=1 Tax=Eucalyptus globulus TaxID=34317 RepID=A0ABD3K9R4_EUCGL
MQILGFSSANLQFHSFIFVIAIALCFVRVSSSSNETDKSALLAFKAGITEDPFGVLSSWNNTVNFYQWYGITCSHRHPNRVTMLNLSGQKLSGSISPHIGNLSFLTGLWLQNNSFHHEIPSQIGRLHRLREIRLNDNSLMGQIPKNISACLKLLGMHLSNNQLSGEVPPEMGSLVKLQILYLEVNHLTGSVPSSIGNLSSLEQLDVSYNYLGGSLPRTLGQLTKVTALDFFGNQLYGMVPPSLYNLSSLIIFDIGSNQIQGSLPITMGFGLPNLQFFSIENNQFVGSIPLSIPNNASNLQLLQIGGNKLLGNVHSFEGLYDLQFLYIDNNHLGSGVSGDLNFLCSLTNMTSLTTLSIFGNRLGGPLPRCIGNISITIKQLDFGQNPIIGEIPREISNLVNLEILGMYNNSFSGAIPIDVGNLQNMTVLSLFNNNLSGVIPSFLLKMKQLLKLSLDGNHFHGHIPLHLNKCHSLMELDLSNNNLNGSIFPVVKTLIYLNLSHKHLNGALPAEARQIDHLDTLDISSNMFGGEITSTLSGCNALTILVMKDNHFRGSIPESISSLRSIEELDLSNNNLSGEIPKFLAAFDFLEFLNISYNKFEGMLPTEGVFKNTSATFIAGNNKLCGGIPEFRLPKCVSRQSKSKEAARKLKLFLSIILGLLGVVVPVCVYICCLKKKKTEEHSSPESIPGNTYLTELSLKRSMENGTNVAVKMLNLTSNGALKSFKAECEALKRIKHRNLLKVLTVCSSSDYNGNDFKALVYEFMVNGSLEEWLHPSPIHLIQRIKISIDIAFALDYLHNQCHSTIVHCDLKPSNVLLNDEMVGHVGDFGLAKIILESTFYTNTNISSAGLRGTIGYTAPEYGMGSVVSVEGDVYSYGILLLEMFTGIRLTAEIFKENLNLHIFVEEALPERVLEITDPILVREMENYAGESRKSTLQDCLLMAYRIGIACSVGVPGERMSITNVAPQLCSIRDKLYATGLRG